MVLLKINNVDFTARVNEKSYTVQKQDVYSSWTDGNWTDHRVIARTRVSGQFTMTFPTEASYTAFLAAVNAVKTTGGYCPVTVWVNNEKALATVNAFLDIQTKHRWTTEAFGQTPELASVTVKLQER